MRRRAAVSCSTQIPTPPASGVRTFENREGCGSLSRDAAKMAQPHRRQEGLVVSVTPERLSEIYPRLYHMAEKDSWPSIARDGLLSTSTLLDLYEVPAADRIPIERRRRPEKVPITHSTRGH